MVNNKALFRWVCALSFVLLLTTAAGSGYWYVFDNDELSHVQTAFLIHRGNLPHVSFFSPYTQIFHSLLQPIFPIFGYSLNTLYGARGVMIVLFVVRLLLFSLLIKIVFNRGVAVLAVILLLLDPFTVFTSMQVRPDNLMVFLSIAAILILAIGFMRRKPTTLFWAGVLMGLSLVTLIKILPTILVATITFAWIAWQRNFHRGLISYIGGIVAVVVLFLGFFAAQGTIPDMVGQVFIDARLLNDSLLYPVRLGNFYWAPNIYLFGLPGRPLVWIFAWILPILAFIGCAFVLTERIRIRLSRDQMDVAKILASILIVQWVSLFFLNSVFIQYYIPITWLFALFAAIAMRDVKAPHFAVFLIFFIALFTYASIRANIARSKITLKSQGLEKQFLDIWREIPESAQVFPNFLFRESPYPFVYGSFYGDIPFSIRSRYPETVDILQKSHIPYVVASNDLLTSFGSETKRFITGRYEKQGDIPGLWILKEKLWGLTFP